MNLPLKPAASPGFRAGFCYYGGANVVIRTSDGVESYYTAQKNEMVSDQRKEIGTMSSPKKKMRNYFTLLHIAQVQKCDNPYPFL